MAVKVTWVPPDGGWGWVIVLCSMMLHAHSIGLLLAMGVMYVSWLEAFDDGRGVTSWVLSIAIALTFGLGPLPAALANLYGFRVVTVAGGLLSFAGFVLSYFATSVAFLMVSIGVIAGTGSCFMYLSAVAIVSVYFSKRRSVAMGIGTSGTGTGVLVAGPILNHLINTYGWRGALLLTGAFQLHVCAFGLLIRPLEKVEIWEDEIENENDGVGHKGEEELCEKVLLAESHEKIDILDHRADAKLLQHSVLRIEETGNGGTNSLKRPKGSRVDLKQEKPRAFKISNGSLQNSNMSLTINPFMSTHNHPNQQRANSMMKIPHGGSLLSVNDTKVYCSLRSLASNGRCPELIDTYAIHLKPQSSMGVVLARSIKHLGSISLLGTLPNHLMCSIEETKHQEGIVESKTAQHAAIDETEYEASLEENKSCLSSIKHNLMKVVGHNVEMLRDTTFLLLGISNIATNIAYAPPVMYIVDRALDSSLDKTPGAMLIALNGIGNIFGRIFFGAVTQRLLQDPLMVYVFVLSAAGVSTLLSPLCGDSVVLHGIYALLIGAFLGGYCTLVALTTVDIMGLEKASASFGLLLFFSGLSTLVGPPLGGLLFDWTQSYTLTYIIYGISLITSVLILLPLACKRRRRKKREERALNPEDSLEEANNDEYDNDGDDDEVMVEGEDEEEH